MSTPENEYVTRGEMNSLIEKIGELVTTQTDLIKTQSELVVEMRYSHEFNSEMKRKQEEMGKRIGAIEQWKSGVAVTLEDNKWLKRTVFSALISIIFAALYTAYKLGNAG